MPANKVRQKECRLCKVYFTFLNGTISASKAGQERNRTSQQSCLDVEADNNVYSVNLHLFLAL